MQKIFDATGFFLRWLGVRYCIIGVLEGHLLVVLVLMMNCVTFCEHSIYLNLDQRYLYQLLPKLKSHNFTNRSDHLSIVLEIRSQRLLSCPVHDVLRYYIFGELPRQGDAFHPAPTLHINYFSFCDPQFVQKPKSVEVGDSYSWSIGDKMSCSHQIVVNDP